MLPGLEIEADLTLTVDGTDIPITGSGNLIVVNFPSLGIAIKLLRQVQQHPQFKQLYRLYNQRSDIAPLAIDVQVNGNTIANINPDNKPGLASRLTGNEGLTIEFAGLLKSLFSSSNKPTDNTDANNPPT